MGRCGCYCVSAKFTIKWTKNVSAKRPGWLNSIELRSLRSLKAAAYRKAIRSQNCPVLRIIEE